MDLLYEQGDVRVSMVRAGEKNRLTIEAPGYVPFRTLDTAYPLSLIEKLIRLKGPIWFADEIARDEDPAYVQRTTKWGMLPFLDASEIANARILDFGCGSGASTAILGRRYPDAEIVGVELDQALIEIVNSRVEFYGLSNVRMLHSPSPDRLPDNLGLFDVINLSAVFEHLLPDERKSLLPMLWEHLKPGGVLFIYETPHRYFPIESHTTRLPLINYLPRPLAHAVIRIAGRPEWRNQTWAHLLRAGVRGGSIREVMGLLGPDARLLPPSRMNVKNYLQLWHAKASEGRRSQRSKDLVYNGLRALKAITTIELPPELSIAVRRERSAATGAN